MSEKGNNMNHGSEYGKAKLETGVTKAYPEGSGKIDGEYMNDPDYGYPFPFYVRRYNDPFKGVLGRSAVDREQDKSIKTIEKRLRGDRSDISSQMDMNQQQQNVLNQIVDGANIPKDSLRALRDSIEATQSRVGNVQNALNQKADRGHGHSLSDISGTGNLVTSESMAEYVSQNFALKSHSHSYNSLTDKPEIPEAQVQADWNETDSSSKAYIKNKPAMTAGVIVTSTAAMSSMVSNSELEVGKLYYDVEADKLYFAILAGTTKEVTIA